MVFSQQFLQTICYFKRVDSYIVGILVDFLITVVIITSPASLILQERLRRRDSITSDITSLVIVNHMDCTVNMVFNMYEQPLLPEIPELMLSKIFKPWMMPYDPRYSNGNMLLRKITCLGHFLFRIYCVGFEIYACRVSLAIIL
jgi:hypothetical protein